MEILRTGSLLETDQTVAGLFQCPENRRQGTMHLDLHRLGAVASDLVDDLRMAAANEPLDAHAAGRAHDVRQIDITPQRRAGNDEFTRTIEFRRRLVADMNEVGHFELKPRISLIAPKVFRDKRIVANCRTLGLVLTIFVALHGCGPTPDRSHESAAPVSASDDHASSQISLKILDYAGLQQLIASKRGKVVVLDAWSTGCPPCLKSFPDLVALQRKIGPDRLACISLSLDYEGIGKPEDVEPAALEFLRKQGATFDNVLASEEPESIYKELGIASIPAVFVFDVSGALRKKFTAGASSKGKPVYELVEESVEQLLAEK
jgi:thiol-disulfide isomerase/thioredoxin